MITNRISEETHLEIQRLAGALPGAEKALDAGARRTIRDAIDLHLSPPKLSLNRSVLDSRAKLDAVAFGTIIDAIMFGLTDVGRRIAADRVASIDASSQRPFRVKEYAKKFLDILPSEYLVVFYRSCLKRGLEEAIKAIEVPKGEAAAKDFFGEPRAFAIAKRLV